MKRTYIENGRRSTSKEITRRNPCRKEKPRSTVEKMERRTGLNKPPAYMKRRRRRRRRRRRMWNLAAEQRFWVQTGGNVGYETVTELNILYGALTSKKQQKKIPVKALRVPGG